jgi:hypothetical protein
MWLRRKFCCLGRFQMDIKPHYYIEDQEWKHFQEVQRLQYIKKIKEHEANRTSTDDRNKYWEENKYGK